MRGEASMLFELWQGRGDVCFIEITEDNEGSSRMAMLLLVYHLLQLRYSSVCVGLRGNVDSRGDYCYKLTGQIMWKAHDGRMLQLRRAGLSENFDILWITPLIVCHETNSSTFGFARLLRSIHVDGEKCSAGVIREREGDKTEDVTASDIPLILQRHSYNCEQNTVQRWTICLTLQSVPDSISWFSSSPVVCPICLTIFPKDLSWKRCFSHKGRANIR